MIKRQPESVPRGQLDAIGRSGGVTTRESQTETGPLFSNCDVSSVMQKRPPFQFWLWGATGIIFRTGVWQKKLFLKIGRHTQLNSLSAFIPAPLSSDSPQKVACWDLVFSQVLRESFKDSIFDNSLSEKSDFKERHAWRRRLCFHFGCFRPHGDWWTRGTGAIKDPR